MPTPSYTEWRDSRWLSHDGHVDVSRERYLEETREPTVEEIEADMGRAHGAIRILRASVEDLQKIGRQHRKDGDALMVQATANSIRHALENIRAHRRRLASWREQIVRIEARPVLWSQLRASVALSHEDAEELTLRRDLPVLRLVAE